jgi:hypothetical protein
MQTFELKRRSAGEQGPPTRLQQAVPSGAVQAIAVLNRLPTPVHRLTPRT